MCIDSIVWGFAYAIDIRVHMFCHHCPQNCNGQTISGKILNGSMNRTENSNNTTGGVLELSEILNTVNKARYWRRIWIYVIHRSFLSFIWFYALKHGTLFSYLSLFYRHYYYFLNFRLDFSEI